MIILYSHISLSHAHNALLSALNETDIVVCVDDGVYAQNAIQSALPHLHVYALASNCEARGIQSASAITFDTLCQLQQQHQQWITL